MKKLFIIFLVSMLCVGVGSAQEQKIPQPAKVGVNYGQYIDNGQAISVKKLEDNFNVSNTFSGKVVGKVSKVCKMSGCYLTLQTDNNENPIMVRFAEDYIVPQDLVGKNVVVEGIATARNRKNKETQQIRKSITMIADGVLVVK